MTKRKGAALRLVPSPAPVPTAPARARKPPAPPVPAPPPSPVRPSPARVPTSRPLWELSDDEITERMKRPNFDHELELAAVDCRLTPGCVSWLGHVGPCRLPRPVEQVLADAKKEKKP